MEYITVWEAAEKWGVSVRRVQYHCSHNMVPGAVQFGKIWTFLKDAAKPRDGLSSNILIKFVYFYYINFCFLATIGSKVPFYETKGYQPGNLECSFKDNEYQTQSELSIKKTTGRR